MEDGQLINLSQHKDRDTDVILKVFPAYTDTHIDVIGASRILLQERMITQTQYENLVRKSAVLVDDFRFATFLLDLLQLISFPELIKCLHLIKCNDLAEELEVGRYNRQMYIVEGTDEVPNGCRIVNYYCRMKSYCDDNVMSDRPSTVLELAMNLEERMPGFTNMHDCQWAADRYATLMQFLVKFYSESSDVDAILERMQQNKPRGINTLYAEILYHSNLGLLCAKGGDDVSARDHIRQVHVLSSTSRQSFIKAFSYYHVQYIYRTLYSKNPSQENFLDALLYCDLALNVLMDMNQADTRLLRCILLLNKIQTLLEIRNDFSVNYAATDNTTNLHAAEELLRTVERNFGKIECRRDMIYSLCKAKTLQDEDLFTTLAYLDRALVQGKDGAYFPSSIENIAAYKNWLALRELPNDW